jgi:hypothetical protein
LAVATTGCGRQIRDIGGVRVGSTRGWGVAPARAYYCHGLGDEGRTQCRRRAERVCHLANADEEPTAAALTTALEAGRAVIAVSVGDRERILRVLVDCPDGLSELRTVLLREHEWRLREGLV